MKLSPLVNVNVKRNDTSVDMNFSPNLAMAALRYSSPLPLHWPLTVISAASVSVVITQPGHPSMCSPDAVAPTLQIMMFYILCKMCRVVTLLMLISPNFCLSFNRLKGIFIVDFLMIDCF